ncbi:MAG: DUF2285 domain-containing protein [Pseudomonadota bacterium]
MKTFTLSSEGVLGRYDYLSRLSTDRWGWEYARRNNDLKRDARTRSPEDMAERRAPCADIRILHSRVPQTLAERWGLIFMPDPEQNAYDADAIWSLGAFPDQVEVNCSPRTPDQKCDIWDRTVPYCAITHVTDGHGREFLLVRGKGCVVQIQCTGSSLLGIEPVRMKLTISDIDAYERKLKTQKAALELYGDGPDLSEPLWTKRTQILRNGLIALDCLEAGLSQKEIAAVIYGGDVVSTSWGDDVSPLRNAIRYVIRKAEGLRDGGYLTELLGAEIEPQAVAG